MVKDADRIVDRIDIIGDEERKFVLETRNRTAAPFPSERCIHELFMDQVRRAPEGVAVVHDVIQLSYAELDARANQLARHLIASGVGPDQLVAICLSRGIGMIVSLLGVLKAGGAYLPLDPVYPAERLRQIVEDAKPKLLIADHGGCAIFADAACEILDLEASASTIAGLTSSAPAVAGLTSKHLAYIIYTSGSTGKPKGVMVEHRGVVNLALTQQEMYAVTPRSRIAQFASFSFDASVWEIVMALCSGAALFLVGQREYQNTSDLIDYLVDNAITHAGLPPAMLQGRTDLNRLATLKVLVLAGESPKAELIKNLPSSVAVFNGYGPTEVTVCATTWLRPADFDDDVIPIGRPIPNQRVYLLDRFGAPVPLGATGEIYVGGAGIARGYLNRTELTEERFKRDPFAGDANARMYRTGDLGRYLPDGNLEFLGRNDHQVKIRGFRIELGEIEFRLNEHSSVSDSVVLVRHDHSGDPRLIAYVAMGEHAGTIPDAGEFAAAMRSHLRSLLPTIWCRRPSCAWTPCRSPRMVRSIARYCRLRRTMPLQGAASSRHEGKLRRSSPGSGQSCWASTGLGETIISLNWAVTRSLQSACWSGCGVIRSLPMCARYSQSPCWLNSLPASKSLQTQIFRPIGSRLRQRGSHPNCCR
jgi:amino acid adenylation domain-containing protein